MIMETPPKSRMIWADLKASPIYGPPQFFWEKP
jgi:hypothetical protein